MGSSDRQPGVTTADPHAERQDGQGSTGSPVKGERRKGRAAAKPRAPKESGDNNVGKVLRTVYQNAVDEDIPAEMLDLLSKLG